MYVSTEFKSGVPLSQMLILSEARVGTAYLFQDFLDYLM